MFLAGVIAASTVAAPLYGMLTGVFDPRSDAFRETERIYGSLLPPVNGGFHGPYPLPGSFQERRLAYPDAGTPHDDPALEMGHCGWNAIGKVNFEPEGQRRASRRVFDGIEDIFRGNLISHYDAIAEKPLWDLSPPSRKMIYQCIRHSLLAPFCVSHVQSLADGAVRAAAPDLNRFRQQQKRELEENFCASMRGPVPGHSTPD